MSAIKLSVLHEFCLILVEYNLWFFVISLLIFFFSCRTTTHGQLLHVATKTCARMGERVCPR